MRSTTFFGILAVITASASLVACGSDTSTSSTTGAGGESSTTTGDTTSSVGGATSTSTSSTTTGTTSSTTTSGTTSSTTTSTSTGGSMLVNGCDPANLEDHTKDATVEIKFGGAVGLKYVPACIKVKSGTMVTFTGSMSTHPLAPGEVVGTTPGTDPTSPIKATNSGTSASFAVSAAGSYPYYCTDHYSSGMKGLIVAE